MNAIIYTRVSTDEQANHGNSLEHQKRILEIYCHTQNINIDKHYKEDHSAKNFDRPEFIDSSAWARVRFECNQLADDENTDVIGIEIKNIESSETFDTLCLFGWASSEM